MYIIYTKAYIVEYIYVYYLREFGLNYRHPGSRRVWKGGSEQQFTTPFPGDPGDPGMNANACFAYAKRYFLPKSRLSLTRNDTFR